MRCLTKTGAAPATEGHHVKRQKDPLLLTLPPFDSVSSGVHERLALMGGEGVSGDHVITNERVVPSQRVQRIPFAFKLHDYSRRPFPEFPLLLDDSIARETAALRAAPREEDHMAHLVTYTEPLNCVTETTEEPTTFSLAPVDCSPLFAQPQRFPFSDVAVSSLQVKDSEMAVHPRLCVDLGLSSVPEKLANLDEVDFMSEDSGDESAAPVEPVLMSQQFARLRGQSDKTPSEALHFDAFVDYFLPGK
ncbi:hypothetical protein AGDE_14353 [Angomonas deanei]|uniref:Uncharacterized protein n=1 Tax=Angomonas deanei TaxID=59799 RepID=A0A7G2C901_9TRYP|nr:hypothetical protein AGDE_14353 [Angomonas deanei]CAD2215915.1 hypothetical protein, conserved [Angomonas deanei]|eukprot:EPY21004.1 hypothetical protein AGDE_14353 [Angomonas deanei]